MSINQNKSLITIGFGGIIIMSIIGKKNYTVRLIKKHDILIISESPDVIAKIWLRDNQVREFMKEYIFMHQSKLFSKYIEKCTNRYISTEIKNKLWAEAKTVKNLDPMHFRKDVFGLIVTRRIKSSNIKYSIDHIIPYSLHGPTKYFNLCVMRLRINQRKSNLHVFQSTHLVEEILEQKRLQKKFKIIYSNKNRIKFLESNYNLTNLEYVNNVITSVSCY
ncbi:hypothetical protein HDU92_008445 [Lobulomyces angularis]|nr:hypothetical protein HDU92_008445 [Lobulomyces angularis]